MKQEFLDYIQQTDAKIEDLQNLVIKLQTTIEEMEETFCRRCEIMFPCTTVKK